MFVMILATIMSISSIIAIVANFLQVGFLFTTELLKFDFKKIDPIQGAKRVFSIRALVELLKSFFKIIFVGTIDRKRTRLKSSLVVILYAVFCLKKYNNKISHTNFITLITRFVIVYHQTIH